jgi:hypothetical protein
MSSLTVRFCLPFFGEVKKSRATFLQPDTKKDAPKGV